MWTLRVGKSNLSSPGTSSAWPWRIENLTPICVPVQRMQSALWAAPNPQGGPSVPRLSSAAQNSYRHHSSYRRRLSRPMHNYLYLHASPQDAVEIKKATIAVVMLAYSLCRRLDTPENDMAAQHTWKWQLLDLPEWKQMIGNPLHWGLLPS